MAYGKTSHIMKLKGILGDIDITDPEIRKQTISNYVNYYMNGKFPNDPELLAFMELPTAGEFQREVRLASYKETIDKRRKEAALARIREKMDELNLPVEIIDDLDTGSSTGYPNQSFKTTSEIASPSIMSEISSTGATEGNNSTASSVKSDQTVKTNKGPDDSLFSRKFDWASYFKSRYRFSTKFEDGKPVMYIHDMRKINKANSDFLLGRITASEYKEEVDGAIEPYDDFKKKKSSNFGKPGIFHDKNEDTEYDFPDTSVSMSMDKDRLTINDYLTIMRGSLDMVPSEKTSFKSGDATAESIKNMRTGLKTYLKATGQELLPPDGRPDFVLPEGKLIELDTYNKDQLMEVFKTFRHYMSSLIDEVEYIKRQRADKKKSTSRKSSAKSTSGKGFSYDKEKLLQSRLFMPVKMIGKGKRYLFNGGVKLSGAGVEALVSDNPSKPVPKEDCNLILKYYFDNGEKLTPCKANVLTGDYRFTSPEETRDHLEVFLGLLAAGNDNPSLIRDIVKASSLLYKHKRLSKGMFDKIIGKLENYL